MVVVVLGDMYNIYKVGGGCWLLKPTQRVGFEPCQDLGFVGSYHRGNDVGLFVCQFLACCMPKAGSDVREPVETGKVNTN